MDEVFKENNLSTKCIRSLATIELKKNDIAFRQAQHELNCELHFFDNDAIASVQNQFEGSQFVENATGVTSVCEPCAHLTGEEIIINKTIVDGITLSVSKSNKR